MTRWAAGILMLGMAACADSAPPSMSDDGSFSLARDASIADSSSPSDASELVDADSLADAGPSDLEAMAPPSPPTGLIRYLTGNPNDRAAVPSGPALLLMGGGADVDEAFEWWRGPINGGDVVVLRASGADGYNDYLYSEIGACDSVETLLVTSRALADDPYVAWTVRHAEGIFIAGGDQSRYLSEWKQTALEAAIQDAWRRGAVVGGTSAGLAVLGQFMFAAYQGGIDSAQALSDLHHERMTIDREFLDLEPLRGLITDSHFQERDRMGRLVAFLARIICDGWDGSVWGLGIDEATALVVQPDKTASVLGSGSVYLLQSDSVVSSCAPGTPPGLHVLRWVFRASDSFVLGSVPSEAPLGLDAADGSLSPSNPY